jgi:hypothetical protein
LSTIIASVLSHKAIRSVAEVSVGFQIDTTGAP